MQATAQGLRLFSRDEREEFIPATMLSISRIADGRSRRDPLRSHFRLLERDQWARELVNTMVVERFEQNEIAAISETAASADDGTDPGTDEGRFERFFKWIIEHQDEIIAFIQKIIALFASAGVVSTA